MNKYLRKAIETVIREAEKCSINEQGQLQYLDSTAVALLIVEYDKYCLKAGIPRLRVRGSQPT